MLFKGIEVTVAVQQRHAVRDAARRDHGVNGLAHRKAKGSKLAKILGGFDGEFQATQIDGMQTGERSLHRIEFAVGRTALQDLRQDQVANSQWHTS